MNDYYYRPQQPQMLPQLQNPLGQPQGQQLQHYPGQWQDTNIERRVDRLEREVTQLQRAVQRIDQRLDRIERRLGIFQ